MIDSISNLKRNLATIVSDKNEFSELNISYVNKNHKKYTNEFMMAVDFLSKAIDENDLISVQCALTRVKIASLNLSNNYQDVIDDIVLINKLDLWPMIPEDYQIPEHYNYPEK